MPTDRVNKLKNKMRNKSKQFTDKTTKFRLPDGAIFQAVYSGEQTKWTVTMRVGDWTQTKIESSLHWTLKKLGHLYNKDMQSYKGPKMEAVLSEPHDLPDGSTAEKITWRQQLPTKEHKNDKPNV